MFKDNNQSNDKRCVSKIGIILYKLIITHEILADNIDARDT